MSSCTPCSKHELTKRWWSLSFIHLDAYKKLCLTGNARKCRYLKKSNEAIATIPFITSVELRTEDWGYITTSTFNSLECLQEQRRCKEGHAPHMSQSEPISSIENPLSPQRLLPTFSFPLSPSQKLLLAQLFDSPHRYKLRASMSRS
jgi:hypothetical protein